jgi:uncharacterized protein YdaU (DUF1376 family)
VNGQFPWFPFYVADYLLDPLIRGMTVEQRGMVVELLAHAWRGGGCLPNEPENLWRLAGAKTPAAFEKHRKKVTQEFLLDRRRNVLVSTRLAPLWKNTTEKSKAFSESGTKGAQVRWKKKPNGQAMATPSSSRWPAHSESESDLESESQHSNVSEADQQTCLTTIWEYYLDKFGRDSTLYELTDTRLQVGYARMNDCLRKCNGDLRKAERLMIYVIDRLAESGFHNGENERKANYVDWETHLFGSLEKMESWINRAAQ